MSAAERLSLRNELRRLLLSTMRRRKCARSAGGSKGSSRPLTSRARGAAPRGHCAPGAARGPVQGTSSPARTAAVEATVEAVPAMPLAAAGARQVGAGAMLATALALAGARPAWASDAQAPTVAGAPSAWAAQQVTTGQLDPRFPRGLGVACSHGARSSASIPRCHRCRTPRLDLHHVQLARAFASRLTAGRNGPISRAAPLRCAIRVSYLHIKAVASNHTFRIVARRICELGSATLTLRMAGWRQLASWLLQLAIKAMKMLR